KPPSEWGAERAPRQQRRRRSAGPERRAHDFLRFLLDAREVLRAAERLGVYFVDVLGAAGARGEPTVFGHDLESAEAVAVARCFRQLGEDWLAREVGSRHLTWVQLLQACLLGAGGGRVDALVGGAA